MRAWALALFSIAALVAVACEDEPVARRCTNIPAGGCPRSYGVACEDPLCEAVYLCRPGNVWELEKQCPARPSAVVDAGGTTPDAAVEPPTGAYGGPGCASLQEPECSLGLALACTNGCCGCEDLFVCENGGWNYWGPCADGGVKMP